MSLKSKKIIEPDFLGDRVESAPPLPWPEWSDIELNAEKWDNPKNGLDGLFSDTQPVIMPPSLAPYEWKRASQLKGLSDKPIVYVENKEYPDFITNNKHLLHSEFVRWFISAMINLQYYGRNGFKLEGESANFTWNDETQWQGWFHVYSLNKAGKGAQHRPVINPNGKYIARLFFMGYWRRFVIDDNTPVDKGGIPLLPRTSRDYELWPMLLAKALLKLAALSWTAKREIVDFHPISCLTGWICLSLDTEHLSPKDKWDFLTKYAENFEWSSKIESNTEAKPSQKRRKSKVKSSVQLSLLETPRPVTLFAKLEDMRGVRSDDVPGIAPCWSHPVYIELSRDIPLDPSQVKPPLAKWKMHRWLEWATRNKIINPEEYFVPIRYLKIVSPLKECDEIIIYTYDDVDDNNKEESSLRQGVLLGKKAQENTKNVQSPKESEKLKDQSLPDISFWGDFNKMTPHMREIHLFYKPSHFEYSTQVSDILRVPVIGKGKPETSTKSSLKGSSKPAEPVCHEFVRSCKWQHKMTRSRNEPLYLLLDSTDCKFLLIDFSTMQPYPPSPVDSSALSLAANDRNAEDSPSTASNFTYLVVESHDWLSRAKRGDPLVETRTSGSTATVLEVGPGRHLLRLFVRSEYSYFLTISSDTVFHLGNCAKMQELMTVESDRVDAFVKKISNCLAKAFQAFGTPDYPREVKNYYQSYVPNEEDISREQDGPLLKLVHRLFQEELLRAVEGKFTEEQLIDVYFAFRVFFVDPLIGNRATLRCGTSNDSNVVVASQDPDVPYALKSQESQGENSASVDYDKAAVTIQSFFRMVLIKSYRKLHDPRHKRHDRILETLRNVAELFNYDKRESLAHYVFRYTIERDDRLARLYPCAEDFRHVLHVQECRGILVNVTPDQWIPIVRLTVNAAQSQVVFAAMSLFTHLPTYVLRVLNNVTGREMMRAVNNVVPAHYAHLETGYTVFGYGWSEADRYKESEWTVRMVTVKGKPVFHRPDKPEPFSDATEIPGLLVEEISNVYVPNVWNLIGRWIVEATAKSAVTFRLKTSYKMVRTRLRLVEEEKTTLAVVEGGHVVILPVVYLESGERVEGEMETKSHRRSVKTSRSGNMKKDNASRSKCYFLEAHVLNDSWPLSEAEWNVVTQAKLKKTSSNIKTSRLSSTTVGGKRSNPSKMKNASKRDLAGNLATLEPPYWVLQVVSDVGSNVEVTQDRRREDEIAALKATWEAREENRLERGRVLRDAFLENNCIIITASIQSELKVSMTPSGHAMVEMDVSSDSAGSGAAPLNETERRTLQHPDNLRKYLPKLDLAMYVVRDEEEEDRWVKTENDEEMLRNQRAINIIDFEQYQLSFLEEMTEILDNQKRRHSILLKKYHKDLAARRNLMDEAYELRQTYIAETNASVVTNTSSKQKTSKQRKK